ncbi:MAG: hypothetical protein PHS86_01980 [Syntrophaceae bacterium]|nr:hypothetical protein [Syntrophaceae bacterium]
MDDIRNMMLGIDTASEIFTLWYEVIYIRTLLAIVAGKAQQSFKGVTHETLITEQDCAEARKVAQSTVQERFPVCKLNFSEMTPEMAEKRKEHLKTLQNFNALMLGKFEAVNPSEAAQESPSHTHHTPSESVDASPLPESE